MYCSYCFDISLNFVFKRANTIEIEKVWCSFRENLGCPWQRILFYLFFLENLGDPRILFFRKPWGTSDTFILEYFGGPQILSFFLFRKPQVPVTADTAVGTPMLLKIQFRKYIQQLWGVQHLECHFETSKRRNFEMYLETTVFPNEVSRPVYL